MFVSVPANELLRRSGLEQPLHEGSEARGTEGSPGGQELLHRLPNGVPGGATNLMDTPGTHSENRPRCALRMSVGSQDALEILLVLSRKEPL